MVARLLTILGFILLVAGLLWAGQGAGLIRWPTSSFMIGTGQWITYGLIVAAIGLFLILLGRRNRRA